MTRKWLPPIGIIVLFATLSFILTACGESTKPKTLKIGESMGPYNVLFENAIRPILEKKGYTIEVVPFAKSLLQSEIALAENSIDFNVAQHTAYVNVFNKERNAQLIPIVHIPSVPAGIYSNRFDALEKIQPGAKIALPQDASNAARAFTLLQKAGWIKLKPGIDTTLATLNDVVENKLNLELIIMDIAQIARAMDDVDYAVLTGDIVHAAKIDTAKAMLREDIPKDMELNVVVNKGNENSQWAQDIVAAYKSDEFKKYMSEFNQNNYWFIPDDIK